MQTDAERTLNNLHILAALSHNDKLMTNLDSFDIYTPTTFRSMMRTWYGESRGQNVNRVRTTVRAAIAFASKALEDAHALDPATPGIPPPGSVSTNASSSSSVGYEALRLRVDTMALQHFRMTDALRRACYGLNNLLQTYREDAALASQIVLLMREVDDFLRVIAPHSESLRTRCDACVATGEIERKSLPP